MADRHKYNSDFNKAEFFDHLTIAFQATVCAMEFILITNEIIIIIIIIALMN
jgi:hypothetical protein